MIECPNCDAELASPRADGLYFDGEQLNCACGTVVQISIGDDDGDESDFGPELRSAAYVGRWWCKQGKSDEEDCAPCDSEYDATHFGFDHSLTDDVCIADDSNECECSRCVAADDDFWRTQEGDPDCAHDDGRPDPTDGEVRS